MLTEQRQKIDAIDKQIVQLFEERMAVVKEVITIKKEHGLPILDNGREEQVIQKVQSYLKDQQFSEDIKDLYIELLSLSRRYQSKQ